MSYPWSVLEKGLEEPPFKDPVWNLNESLRVNANTLRTLGELLYDSLNVLLVVLEQPWRLRQLEPTDPDHDDVDTSYDYGVIDTWYVVCPSCNGKIQSGVHLGDCIWIKAARVLGIAD